MKHMVFLASAFSMVCGLLLVSCHQHSFDDQVEADAAEFTAKQCPRKMSEGVVMDSMAYSRGERCLSYYYTLSGKVDTPQLVRENIATFRTQLVKQIVNSVELKKAKDEGINFRYVYFSASSHKPIVEVKIGKADYSK